MWYCAAFASSIVYIRNAKPKRHKQIASPSRACLSGRAAPTSIQADKPSSLTCPSPLSAHTSRLAPLARGTESGLRGGAQRATKLPSLHCRPYSSHPHHRLTSSYKSATIRAVLVYCCIHTHLFLMFSWYEIHPPSPPPPLLAGFRGAGSAAVAAAHRAASPWQDEHVSNNDDAHRRWP